MIEPTRTIEDVRNSLSGAISSMIEGSWDSRAGLWRKDFIDILDEYIAMKIADAKP